MNKITSTCIDFSRYRHAQSKYSRFEVFLCDTRRIGSEKRYPRPEKVTSAYALGLRLALTAFSTCSRNFGVECHNGLLCENTQGVLRARHDWHGHYEAL